MEKVETTAQRSEPPAAAKRDRPEDGCCVRLSERDAEQVMTTAENPPAPNAAALSAAKRFLQHRG